MDLIDAIRERVAQLDSTKGKQAAVDYFKPAHPNLTRQQLNAWVKNGKFPPEILNHFFASEFESDPGNAPSAASPPPDNKPAPSRMASRPTGRPTKEDILLAQEILQAAGETDEPPPSSEFTDANEATLPPHMIGHMRVATADGKPLPEAAASRLPQYRGPVHRTTDIQRLERRSALPDADYDPVLESQIIEILHRLGVRMPALENRGNEQANGGGQELLGANPKFKFRQRDWNSPPTPSPR